MSEEQENWVAAIRKLRAAIARTLARAEADAIIASTLHEENILVRRALRESEHEPDGWQLAGQLRGVFFSLDVYVHVVPEGFSVSQRTVDVSATSAKMTIF